MVVGNWDIAGRVKVLWEIRDERVETLTPLDATAPVLEGLGRVLALEEAVEVSSWNDGRKSIAEGSPAGIS